MSKNKFVDASSFPWAVSLIGENENTREVVYDVYLTSCIRNPASPLFIFIFISFSSGSFALKLDKHDTLVAPPIIVFPQSQALSSTAHEDLALHSRVVNSIILDFDSDPKDNSN